MFCRVVWSGFCREFCRDGDGVFSKGLSERFRIGPWEYSRQNFLGRAFISHEG